MSDGTVENLRVRGRAPALAGEARVPGDKSIGHRAVLFAAIADGSATVRGLSGGGDNRSTVACLRALGVGIVDVSPGVVTICGAGLDGLRAAAGDLDCGNSGTSMRLLCGLLASRPFDSRLVGDEYLHVRPMRRVADPLRAMGARVDGQPGKKADEIYPPLVISALVQRKLSGIIHQSKVASAQVKSAILLAGLAADGVTTVIEPERSRDHTERMLAAMGAPLTVEDLTVRLDPRGWDGRLRARDFEVPGDLSSAAFLLGAAAVVPGSRVVVRGVGINPTRTGVIDALQKMGAHITVHEERVVGGEPVADLECVGGALRGIEIAGELAVRAIDELPLLAAVAAHATGTTHIRDAAELRVKESDRIAATAAMLRALGVAVEEQADGLTVEGNAGGGVTSGVVESHGDHRIAMAGAICALGAEGETLIRDTRNVATSFPSFAATLAALGVAISR